jgi:hypothetical protein
MAEEAAGEAAVADAPAEKAAGEASDRVALEEARAWAGQKLDEIGGTTVGRVDGIHVDVATGEPEWLVARLGRFGHHTLVPAREAVGGAGHVWVPYTRDQVRGAPKFQPGSTLSTAQEKQLLSHYGVGAEAGRAAEIANREDSAQSARPAA